MVQIQALLNFCLLSVVAGQFYKEGGAFAWENNQVSYRFLNMTAGDRSVVKKQMEVIEKNTCLVFKELTEDEDKDQKGPLHNLYIRGNTSSHPEASCIGPDGEVTSAIDVGVIGSSSIGFVVNLNICTELADQEKCKDNPNITGGIMNRLFTIL